MLPPPSGIVTLLTDFGLDDPYVGIMHGVVKREHLRAAVVDLCHAVPPQAVAVGALFLGAAAGRFPPGTVHVAVVDPGVGTDRRILGVLASGCYWLAPDNGLLGAVLASADEVRALDLEAFGVTNASATFHGRDVFAPVAGRLSSGRYGYRSIGRKISDPVALEPGGGGPRVVHVDRFGNLITDIDRRTLEASGAVAVGIAGRTVPLQRTYADVAAGAVVALVNSYELLEIAVRGGDARRELGAEVGAPVQLQTGPGGG